MERPFYAPTRSGSPFLVFHVCGICHNPRSKSYHLRHPVVDDTLPELTVCTACAGHSARPPSTVAGPEPVAQPSGTRRHIPFRHVEAPYNTADAARRHVPFRHVEAPLPTVASVAPSVEPSTVTPHSSVTYQGSNQHMPASTYEDVHRRVYRYTEEPRSASAMNPAPPSTTPAPDYAFQAPRIYRPVPQTYDEATHAPSYQHYSPRQPSPYYTNPYTEPFHPDPPAPKAASMRPESNVSGPPRLSEIIDQTAPESHWATAYEEAPREVPTRSFKEAPPRERKSVRVEVPSAAHGPFHAEVSPSPSMEVLM